MREIDMADQSRINDNPGNNLTLNISRHQYYKLGDTQFSFDAKGSNY